MTSTLTVSGKVIGKTQPIFTDWQLGLKQEEVVTLRDLLTQVVHREVAGFAARQQQCRVLNVLSPAQINAGIEQGKVVLGGSDLDQNVNVDEAIALVLQAFTDGLYFVFLDEQQQENLDDIVTLRPNSQLLFLRLIPLVGG
ncbi:hypothetical protein ACQ4M4_18640 [Leptolyngbya sp. AN02str]|uniref:hypothetical protein n=1 Tax=Leptolyngbya sp. AN02str TaxID=3423363 RepID=UPI003D3243E0